MPHLRPASAGQAISRGADWASAGEATLRRSAREIPAKAAARMVPSVVASRRTETAQAARRCRTCAMPGGAPTSSRGRAGGTPHARALVSLRVGLVRRHGAAEGVKLHAGVADAADRRVGREVGGPALGADDLGDEADVGEGGCVAVAEAAGLG